MVLERPRLMQISTIPRLELGPIDLAVTLEETKPESLTFKIEVNLDQVKEGIGKNRIVGLDRLISVSSTTKNRKVGLKRVICIGSTNKNSTVDINKAANFDCIEHVCKPRLQQDSPMVTDSDVCDIFQELSCNIHINQSQKMSTATLNPSDSGHTVPDFSILDDIQTDCADDTPILSRTELFDFFKGTSSPDALVLSSPFSSSDEEEGSGEENLFTDPRYVKKFEQALKLGYSEQSVVAVLKKLSPECGLNDLLSGLISLGDSSPDDVLHHKQQEDAGLEDCDVANDTSGSANISENRLLGRENDILNLNWRNNLHYIIIDGSNVAMSHGKNAFSCRGIQIAVEWFQARGHEHITVFIPQWRKEASRPDAVITDQDILYDLEKQGIVVFTPARRVKGRRVVCYDDRFILKLAVETDGIVVSNDVYRDLVRERDEYRHVVDHRLLMYSFVNDRFMPPEDPLGRMGPTLDDFLCKTPLQTEPKPQNCPYGKKCTYGIKCRYYHPERGFAFQKSITETLKEQAQVKLQERTSKILEAAEKGRRQKQKLSRTKSMIPMESLPASSLSLDTNEARKKLGKPKLAHSKSLILPDKSSDYLNEPRKKLEEAELAAVLEQMVVDDLSFEEKSSLGVCDSAARDKLSKTPSPTTSLSHQTEASTQNTLASDIQFTPLSALNVSDTTSPEPFPTIHNVAPLESPEKYVSGHLLLAKKLSYENEESTVFSDRVSNASSMQTFCQANFPGNNTELVQGVARRGQDISFSTASGFPQTYPFHTPQSHEGYMPATARYPTLARSVSTNTQTVGTPVLRQQTASGVSAPLYRREILDSMKFHDYVDPRSPDSGVYTSNEGITKSFPSHPEGHFQICKSYPPLNHVEPAIPQRFKGLHRAYSSTDNVRTAEEFQRKLAMRMPSSASPQLYSDLMASNQHPQYGVPVQLTSTPCQVSQPPSLSRQNSISDPQIHSSSGVGNFPGIVPSVFQDNPASSIENYYCSQNQQLPKQLQHFQQQNLRQNYQQDQHKDPDVFRTHQVTSPQFPQFVSVPKVVNWGPAFHSTNLDAFSPRETAAQHGQFSPQPNTIFFPNNSNIPYFQSVTANQSMSETVAPHILSPSRIQSTVPSPQSPAMLRPLPTGAFSTGPFFHSYPMSAQQNNIHYDSVQSTHPAANSQIFKEDSEILPNDARYTIYYHLSSVFGEPIVRKVLNLNPDVKDPTQICQLLMKYKETGS